MEILVIAWMKAVQNNPKNQLMRETVFWSPAEEFNFQQRINLAPNTTDYKSVLSLPQLLRKPG
jgi:hypothetical protein